MIVCTFPSLTHLAEGKYPFRRLLSEHARAAFKSAKDHEWITEDVFSVRKHVNQDVVVLIPFLDIQRLQGSF